MLGLGILCVCAGLLLAGEAGWIHSRLVDEWFVPLLKIGGLCFVAGLGLSLLQPLARVILRGRCSRCGAPIERGQSYCLDHLRQTVREAQDAVRQAESYRTRR
jgi:hypothetical protein